MCVHVRGGRVQATARLFCALDHALLCGEGAGAPGRLDVLELADSRIDDVDAIGLDEPGVGAGWTC